MGQFQSEACFTAKDLFTTKGVEITGIYNKMPLFRACPNCGSQIHVRKLACPCGHSVFRGSKLLTTRNASRKSDVGAARALETDEQTAKRRKSDRTSPA